MVTLKIILLVVAASLLFAIAYGYYRRFRRLESENGRNARATSLHGSFANWQETIDHNATDGPDVEKLLEAIKELKDCLENYDAMSLKAAGKNVARTIRESLDDQRDERLDYASSLLDDIEELSRGIHFTPYHKVYPAH